MKDIKVVRIIARLNIGGPALHTIFLNEGLERDGFRTHLITGAASADEGDITYLAKQKGLNVTVVPELGRNIKLGTDFIAFWKIFKIIQKERPDIVHTHTAKAGVLGRCAAILNGVPVRVHSFHGHVFDDYFSPAMTKMFLGIERVFAHFTDCVIVVSDIIKDDICNRFKLTDGAKTAVIRLGLDLERFVHTDRLRGNFRRELGIDEKTLLVGIVGRLVPIKNHRMFFEAAGLLKKEMPALNVKFLVIGDGELRSSLKAYAEELGLKDLVDFLGWRMDMPEIYTDLDVVALTSLNEGTPVSLIEAMASGRAVVATAVGGVPDLVEDKETGLLVDSNNAAHLKEAILKLVSSGELRRKLGERASEYVCAAYSKERLIDDMERLYKELIRIKRGKEGKG